MSMDEGYVKYRSRWTPGPPVDAAASATLDGARRRLHDAGLIGIYTDLGIGYGNLSLRFGDPGQFLISGTQTGHLRQTTGEHYALVTAVDAEANTVACRGPVQASSEAMTHAAIYSLDESIGAVVHVHDRSLWQQLCGQLPTTAADIAYGTPEMAREFARLYQETDFATSGVAVMAGHEEGLISFGETLEEATARILRLRDGCPASPSAAGSR